jgi:putative ABC transport system permease protein
MRLLAEIHHAARSLGRSPLLVVVAVGSLALGIGVNATIFNFINAVEFRPLPFPEPERLVDVSEDNPKELCEGCGVGTAWPTYQVWKAQARSFSALEAFRESPVALSGQDEPERVGSAIVTAGLFPMLGVRPILGRTFVADDDRPGAVATILLGHGLWTNRFGADSGILGRTVRVNGTERVVIGIMPPRFRFPEYAALWLPMAREVAAMAVTDRSLSVVGRLSPGTSIEAAGLEMTGVAQRLASEQPVDYANWTARVGSLRSDLSDDASNTGFQLALGASGFILLIACANLANLFLARSAGRARELAVRVALGASRGRIALHVLTESVLLGLLGGVGGLLLSFWGVRLVIGLIGAELPFWLVPAADWRLLVFTLALSLLAGITFGLVPALRASRTDLTETLKTGSLGQSAGRGDSRIRNGLAVAQIALAIVLLAGAGAMVRTFLTMRRTDNLGYDPKRVMTAQVQLQAPRYAEAGAVRRMQEQLLERMRSQPMVEASAVEHHVFLNSFVGTGTRIQLEGSGERVPMGRGPGHGYAVTPEYFALMGIPVVSGRGIASSDGPESPPVAVVNRRTAELFWPGADPLDKHFRIDEGPWITVVGVVGDGRGSPYGRGPSPFLYLPAAQQHARPFTVLVRFRGDPGVLGTTLKAVSRTVDADEPVEDVLTMEQTQARGIAPVRFMVTLLLVMGGIALALATFGIYGVMAYMVARRTRELGIRMALGAEGRMLRRWVMGRGLRLASLGLLIGLPAALGLMPLLRRALFNMRPADPLVLGAVAVLLGAMAVLACWQPARRATRVDPLDALRAE